MILDSSVKVKKPISSLSCLFELMRMPQSMFCKGCGHILYRGVELKPADEIIQLNAGQCPKCGKKLSFHIEDIEIMPFQSK